MRWIFVSFSDFDRTVYICHIFLIYQISLFFQNVEFFGGTNSLRDYIQPQKNYKLPGMLFIISNLRTKINKTNTHEKCSA